MGKASQLVEEINASLLTLPQPNCMSSKQLELVCLRCLGVCELVDRTLGLVTASLHALINMWRRVQNIRFLSQKISSIFLSTAYNNTFCAFITICTYNRTNNISNLPLHQQVFKILV